MCSTWIIFSCSMPNIIKTREKNVKIIFCLTDFQILPETLLDHLRHSVGSVYNDFLYSNNLYSPFN